MLFKVPHREAEGRSPEGAPGPAAFMCTGSQHPSTWGFTSKGLPKTDCAAERGGGEENDPKSNSVCLEGQRTYELLRAHITQTHDTDVSTAVTRSFYSEQDNILIIILKNQYHYVYI